MQREKTPQKKYAVLYLRYSSNAQNEQSIEGQRDVCMKFAADNGYTVVKEYIDRATTGKNDNRKYFQQMLKDSEQRLWQYVMVYKLDRFARNKIEAAINRKRLKDNDVKIISAMENIPDTPEGILLESLLEGLNEYYSLELAQKVNRGIAESRKKGNFIGGHTPYGYKIENKKYVPLEHEAIVVKKIFTDYSNGKTVPRIVEELTAKGITNHRGKPFAKNSIYTILRTEKYIGNIRASNGEFYEGVVEPIIDKEVFRKVEKIIENNKRLPNNRKALEGSYILTGKLYCGYCQQPMIGESGKSHTGTVYHYYKCATQKKDKDACHKDAVPQKFLEDLVVESTIKVFSPSVIEHVSEKAYKLHRKRYEANEDIKVLEYELTDTQKKIDNIMKAIEDGVFTSTTKDRLLDLEKTRDLTKYALECEKDVANANVTKEMISGYLNSIMQQISLTDENKKEHIIRSFVKKVVLFNDKIIITYNYFDPNDSKYNKEVLLSDLLNGSDSPTEIENPSSNKGEGSGSACKRSPFGYMKKERLSTLLFHISLALFENRESSARASLPALFYFFAVRNKDKRAVVFQNPLATPLLFPFQARARTKIPMQNHLSIFEALRFFHRYKPTTAKAPTNTETPPILLPQPEDESSASPMFTFISKTVFFS